MQAIAGLTPSTDVDAYLLLIKRKDHIFGSADGTGTVLYTQTGDDRHAAVYGLWTMVLVDAKTLNVIKWQNMKAQPHMASTDPMLLVSQSLWATKAKDLTPDRTDRVRRAFTRLIAETVPETEQQMLLLGLVTGGSEVSLPLARQFALHPEPTPQSAKP